MTVCKLCSMESLAMTWLNLERLWSDAPRHEFEDAAADGAREVS